ncbi:MAG TPA: hypothetical protein VGI74_20000 [Streptosporangiaceae bacterium]
MKRPIVVALAAAVIAVAVLAGCTSPQSPAAGRKAAAQVQHHIRLVCSEQAAWDQRGEASVKALYADTGALSADASASNPAGVTKAGRKLSSDAVAAAILPLPPVAPGFWKALTAHYAAAGTAIAAGNMSGAVPELEAGSSAISAFSAAAGKCPGTNA